MIVMSDSCRSAASSTRATCVDLGRVARSKTPSTCSATAVISAAPAENTDSLNCTKVGAGEDDRRYSKFYKNRLPPDATTQAQRSVTTTKIASIASENDGSIVADDEESSSLPLNGVTCKSGQEEERSDESECSADDPRRPHSQLFEKAKKFRELPSSSAPSNHLSSSFALSSLSTIHSPSSRTSSLANSQAASGVLTTASMAANANGSDEKPLDFSMKKRKVALDTDDDDDDENESSIGGGDRQQLARSVVASTEGAIARPFARNGGSSRRKVTSTTSGNSSLSPMLLPAASELPRKSAFESVAQRYQQQAQSPTPGIGDPPIGASLQQLLSMRNTTGTNGSAPPFGDLQSFLSSLMSLPANLPLPFSHLLPVAAQQPAPTGKLQRPFKAYNPADPSTALQLGAFAMLNGAAQRPVHPPMAMQKCASFPQPEALLANYRQLLLGGFVTEDEAMKHCAMTKLNGNSRSETNLDVLLSSSSTTATKYQNGKPASARRSSSTAPKLSANGGEKNGTTTSSTPSPPQVTSTTVSNPSSSPENLVAVSPASPHVNGHTESGAMLKANGTKDALTLHTDSDESAGGTSSGASNLISSLADVKRCSLSSTSSGSECSAPTSTTPNGSTTSNARRRGRSFPEEMKDDAYWERRRKNNEAAKRSRDMRRSKEDEIALRAALLEQENLKLRIEVASLKAEVEKLRQLLLNA